MSCDCCSFEDDLLSQQDCGHFTCGKCVLIAQDLRHICLNCDSIQKIEDSDGIFDSSGLGVGKRKVKTAVVSSSPSAPSRAKSNLKTTPRKRKITGRDPQSSNMQLMNSLSKSSSKLQNLLARKSYASGSSSGTSSNTSSSSGNAGDEDDDDDFVLPRSRGSSVADIARGSHQKTSSSETAAARLEERAALISGTRPTFASFIASNLSTPNASDLSSSSERIASAYSPRSSEPAPAPVTAPSSSSSSHHAVGPADSPPRVLRVARYIGRGDVKDADDLPGDHITRGNKGGEPVTKIIKLPIKKPLPLPHPS